LVLRLAVKGEAKYTRVKKETHAARWGLLRGYSGKATKWVDFVCGRLNPKGVMPLIKSMGKRAWSQGKIVEK
jgi:hypothetical protein